MSHPLYNVTDFTLLGNYTLRVTFDDNTVQEVDMEPVLYGEMYGPLRDPEVITLVWPRGADFDPYVLHEWPHVVDELARRLRVTA